MYLKYLLPIVGISALLLSGSPALAQTEKAPRIHSGSPAIEGYYGTNFTSYLLKALITPNQGMGWVELTRAVGIGPGGIRVDIPLGKSPWSAGVEGACSYYAFDWQDVSTADTIITNLRIMTLTAQGRIAFHIPAGERFDPYLMGNIGYRYAKVTWNESGTARTDLSIPVIPVSARVGAGCRFVLNPRISLMAEAAIGGALLAGGVSVRLKP